MGKGGKPQVCVVLTEQDPELDLETVRAVLRALAEHGVDYAVFGAVALGLHGLSRSTLDVDADRDLPDRQALEEEDPIGPAVGSGFALGGAEDRRAGDARADRETRGVGLDRRRRHDGAVLWSQRDRQDDAFRGSGAHADR